MAENTKAERIVAALKKEGFTQVRDKSTDKEVHVVGFGKKGGSPDGVCRVKVKTDATASAVDAAVEKAVKAYA